MKKQDLKRLLLLGVPLVLLLGYLVFVFIEIKQEEKEAKAGELSVVMTNPQFNFVSKGEILAIAKKEFGDIKKLKHDSINRNKLEITIKKNPFVEDAQVFRTGNGAYRVEIKQRTPFLRVWTDKESYYLDKIGFRMPTGVKYPSLVRLYSGAITEKFAKNTLLKFQNYLENNAFWNEMVDYVEVNGKKELILYLKVKSGKIYLGKFEQVAEKMEKFKIFIEKLGKYNGLDIYESVDLRFENQVVVKKKKNATK